GMEGAGGDREDQDAWNLTAVIAHRKNRLAVGGELRRLPERLWPARPVDRRLLAGRDVDTPEMRLEAGDPFEGEQPGVVERPVEDAPVAFHLRKHAAARGGRGGPQVQVAGFFVTPRRAGGGGRVGRSEGGAP